MFAEEDYLALAQVYAEEGNWKEQRRMLSRALRLYPCAEFMTESGAPQAVRDNAIRGNKRTELKGDFFFIKYILSP